MRRLFARVVVALRWLVVVGWIAGAVAASHYLPSFVSQASPLERLIPEDAPAVQTSKEILRRFGFPLDAHAALVQHDPGGLSTREQVRIVTQAARLSATGFGPPGVAAAVPIINRDVVPGARRSGPATTAVTFLYIRPGAHEDPLEIGQRAAAALSSAEPDLPRPLVTGLGPAEIAGADAVLDRLRLLEIATAAIVSLLVAVHFRSVVAPLVTLAAVAIAYLVAMRVVAWLAQELGIAVSDQARPVVVALMFGVVTDYTVFFAGRMRQWLRDGASPKDAARESARDVVGAVTAAALTIALASLALLVGRFELFHVFGPAMAVAVVVAWAVTITLTPALMAIAGRRLFWPSRVEAVTASERPRRRGRLVAVATRHPVISALLCVLLLAAGASGLWRARIYNPTVLGLPSGSEPARGLRAASDGFVPGVLSPLTVLVEAPDVGSRRAALGRLARALGREPGVVAVLGPSDVPALLPDRVFVDGSGDAARLLVIPRAPPLSPDAIDVYRALEGRLSALVAGAGLPRASAALAGDAAVTSQTIDLMFEDLFERIGPAVLVVLFVVLAVYLRAIVAPLYLLAASVAALLTALGVTAYVFQDVFGVAGIGFFVPVAAFVLLVALGSDYNIFLVGRIWDSAGAEPLRETVAEVAPKAAASISAAGLALAGSFAVLAIVPTTRFREVAFAMAVGLLVDAFLVRSLLVPSLISLVGRASGWPGKKLRPPEADTPDDSGARSRVEVV